jgi:hypothetical protein
MAGGPVQQLTALDVMFSSLDTETTNGVLGGLVLHEPPADGRRAADAAFMRQRLAERLPFLPPLHRQLVTVPIGIDHDGGGLRSGAATLYLHMTNTLPNGTTVKRGDVIGKVGKVGASAVHLHYEQRYNWVAKPAVFTNFTAPYNTAMKTGIGVSVPASANCPMPASNGGGQIKGVGSGRCLDVQAVATTPGGRLQLYTCLLGQPNQRWLWTTTGELTVYTGSQKMCLDLDISVGTPQNGSRVQVWPCLGSANQRWYKTSDGAIHSVAYPSLVLDCTGFGTVDGTVIQVWTAATPTTSNQRWTGP